MKTEEILLKLMNKQNVCGMSVVGPEFETFKRFNLAEINRQHDEDPPKKKMETG